MSKIKELVDIPTAEVETAEVETAPVPQEEVPVVNEKKTIKQKAKEFADKHPVAVRRAKKIGKAVAIGGAAVVGALYGFSKMAEAKGYGSNPEEGEATEDSLPFEGSDVSSEISAVEE